ncbi:hypothetical protein [Christiangramia fulva]|nr:hypothetical protein [Christiangramia fulva]
MLKKSENMRIYQVLRPILIQTSIKINFYKRQLKYSYSGDCFFSALGGDAIMLLTIYEFRNTILEFESQETTNKRQELRAMNYDS